MPKFPITLGAVNSPSIDWSKFDELCQSRLGFIPKPGQRLYPAQWEKLGYVEAGKARLSDWR